MQLLNSILRLPEKAIMKNVILILLLFLASALPVLGQTDVKPPRKASVAGFYLFGDYRGGRVRDMNGNTVSPAQTYGGIGYFRTLENGNEWHVTAGTSVFATNDFFSLNLKTGFQYRLMTQSLWKGRLQPYLGLGGGVTTTFLSGNNIAFMGNFDRRTFISPFVGIYPGMKVKLGEKCFVDLSVPVELPLMSFSHATGPAISENTFRAFHSRPFVGLRLGIGLGGGKK
jgi:hypothetical protein